MSDSKQPPIFCDHCASLAFAFLDDTPLCAQCLDRMVKGGAAKLEGRVTPLSIEIGIPSAPMSTGTNDSSDPPAR